MNHPTVCLLLIFLFVTAEASAQKNKLRSIKWDMAGVLPSTNDRALGFAGPVVGVNNDALIVAGGCNFPDSMPWLGGKKAYYNDLYVFKKDSKDSLILFMSFHLPVALAYSANVSTAQGIVVAGGENESGISNKVSCIQWADAGQKIRIEELPSLPFAVTNATAVWYDNKIYLAGGEMNSGVSDQLLCLDLKETNRGWKNLPPLPRPVSHQVMVVQSNGRDDCIYIIGGRKKNAGSTSDLYASTFQFNLKTNTWTEKTALPYTLSAGTGVACEENSILIIGGDSGATFHKTEELIAAINNEKDPDKKKELNIQKIKVQSMHPGFCRQVLLYDTKKDQWKPAGCIPFDAPVTTTAVTWNGEVLIPGGEIKAGVRTTQILRCAFSE